MNDKKRIELAVELTEFEIDVTTDYANNRMQSLEEFLAEAAEEQARQIAYDAEWDDDILTQEEIEEFTNNYDNDQLIDFLRDTKGYE